MLEMNGRWSLVIRGEDINKQEIQQKLMMNSLPLPRKSKILLIKNDALIFGFDFDNQDKFFSSFEVLYNKFIGEADFFKSIIKKHNVVLRLYIQSEDAQIYFNFPSTFFEKVTEMGVNMELSIFSWGMVEAE